MGVVVCLVFLCQTQLRAELIEIDDKGLFSATVNGTTTIDFESLSIPSNSYTTPSGNTTLVMSNVTFYDSVAIYEVNGTGFSLGDGSQYIQGNGYAPMTATLQTGYSAAGSDVFEPSPPSGSAKTETGTVTASNGDKLDFSISVPAGTGNPSEVFLGFIETAPGASISSITYDNPNDPGIDNFTYGSVNIVAFDAATAPLPSGFAAGLVLLSATLAYAILNRRVVRTR